jgi:branched-chain amino acid transport system permease protein
MRHLAWFFKSFRDSTLTIPGRVIALCFFLFLLLLPLMTRDLSVLRITTLAGIFVIFAASWDLLAGYAGQVNLGQALFFGVSAYGTAMLNKYFAFPIWIGIPIGSLCAVVVGLVVCIPALRLRGFYLSLVTLAFPIILTGIIFVFSDLTGGEQGIYGLSKLSQSRILNYYIVLVAMIGSLIAMHCLTDVRNKRLRFGVILNAIREDEIAARASGIDTTKYKLMVFAISGFFAGIAGGLYAHYMRIAGPSILSLFFSFQPILWTIFGGLSTLYGAVTGVFILYPLMEVACNYEIGEHLRFILLSFVLILTLIFMPEGIAVWIRDRIEVRCQRCKVVNGVTRSVCRVCHAPLHFQKEDNP